MKAPPDLIPERWSGQEALIIAAFLEELVRAIWNKHGVDMGETLRELTHRIDTDVPTHFCDDDIPF